MTLWTDAQVRPPSCLEGHTSRLQLIDQRGSDTRVLSLPCCTVRTISDCSSMDSRRAM
jgi:hypothetical protein